MLVIRFGLFFKNSNEADYNANWSEKIKHSIEDVIEQVKKDKNKDEK